MKSIFTFSLLLLACIGFAQTEIKGKVTDQKGEPIPGANIFIEGAYDGTSSQDDGSFAFSTAETGKQTLVISFLSFETIKMEIDVATYQPQTIKMRESVNVLDAVIVNAGTFEAGDKARVSVLKPLDIVTTAGSAGDIVAALQTLPGTQTVGEDGRLFVRGGEADETQTFVDGIRVAQPYGSTTNNLPTRGRFSPFLFSGISFSTGGYSAEYGEALSSVLLLNTQDDPDQNKTDIALMTVGLGLGHTKKWEKSSISVNASYIDLAPYQWAIPQNVSWNRPFQQLSGEAVYRKHFEYGLLKVYVAFDSSRFDVNQESINTPTATRVDLRNDNLYFNASYKGDLGRTWQLTAGLGYGLGKNNIGLDLDDVKNTENAVHMKLKLSKRFSDRIKLNVGGDYFITDFDESYQFFQGEKLNAGYTAGIAAAYSEADVYFSKKLAMKIGARAAYNDLLHESVLSPRASLAYKLGKKAGQVSFAYGDFQQSPKADYLKYSDFHRFDNEKATHYILNYQYTRERQTLRAEAYYKDYRNLVKYDDDVPQFDSNYSNNGSGYAKGIDLFWRDGRTFRNLEYWISYSYIDSKRDYRNFPIEATPNFVANQGLSVVTKYWIEDWKSQVSLTHSMATGRPFDNPNKPGFLQDKTRAYNNLSVSWAYLLTQQKILYFSVSNVLGTQNVYNYEYANTPSANGVFQRREITPTADRFFFVGFFWTISADKKSNQLKNL
ncbi:TonB-dependent receptor [Flavobacterium sp. MAH-1]|uniref:TonB-dependent receptor n=1 Tax=Flavobacterium agri TaxID=2743471 RepID=A0A7Y9C5N1_9FLAO|nr:TonB-dependent receptor [Flavobacterium agri]NUY81151.1 TonB-dependent receptor [Flavobacterium agri]NYA71175.1 TonB-dependent receptor [Flavobacterium agri]